MKNALTERLSMSLLKKLDKLVVNRRGKQDKEMRRLLKKNAANLGTLLAYALEHGVYLVMKPPHQDDWFRFTRWQDCAKQLVFHFYRIADADNEKSEYKGLFYLCPEALKLKRKSGVSVRTFSNWLVKQNAPQLWGFCALAYYLGWKLEWRKINE